MAIANLMLCILKMEYNHIKTYNSTHVGQHISLNDIILWSLLISLPIHWRPWPEHEWDKQILNPRQWVWYPSRNLWKFHPKCKKEKDKMNIVQKVLLHTHSIKKIKCMNSKQGAIGWNSDSSTKVQWRKILLIVN